jgi:protease I
MEKKLHGVKVAILVADGFEQSEMVDPKKALDLAGAETAIVSPVKGKVRGWKQKDWGDAFLVDIELSQADAGDFDALLLPGGLMNPDTLRMDPLAVEFVKSFLSSAKPIAAICHGPWMLINAEGVKGKMMTSWPAIKVDLVNAGGNWVDQEVVKDDKLVTSRKPEDIPAFNAAMIDLFEKTCKP